MSQKHLFLFTISPVQSFIAQARKTQDLYAGSRILSDLIKIAIETIGKENVIFPFVKDENLQQIESLPNRFIAEINKPENELAGFGKEVEGAVKAKFKRLADEIFTKTLGLNKETTHKVLYQKFDKQISQHLDIHWLFLPFTDETYAEKFKEIEQLLGAIKNTRTFEQNEETGRKCSLDGERNALFCAKGSKNSLQLKPNWSLLSQEHEKSVKDFNSTLTEIYKGNFQGNEGLSAVSLVKRLYKDEDFKSFPSTAEIALMNDIKDFTPEELEIFDCYQKLFSKDKFPEACLKMFNEDLIKSIKVDDLSKNEDWNTHFDYQLLFEDNINEKTIPDKQQLKLAKILFSKIQRKLKTKYYALIAFDADSMGEWLSGSKTNGDLRKFHQELSQNLLAFGKEAKDYLDKDSRGKAVYAGGDDFIGFVNLKKLFPVMRELRKLFKELVSDKVKASFKNPTDEISFSAGVVIAHYKMPLGETLNWARRMEHEAKEIQGKDAFAIAVLKKSGEIIQAKSKWKDTNGNYLTDSFEYLYKELEKGKDTTKKEGFSPTFIKSLNRELDIFETDLRKTHLVSLDTIIHTEMKRLTERACNLTDKKAKKDAVVDINTHLKLLFENSEYAESKVNNFLQTLNLSDFLTRKITQE